MADSLVELDGSLGEGGGQILRTSLTLSLLTGIPFKLANIRAGRSKPGLQPQHLASVRAAAAIGQAEVQGDRKDSLQLMFKPGAVVAGKYHFSIGTAGATSLVLQTIYLPLALRGQEASEVTITGGTHVKASPCYHFLESTWRAYLEMMGLRIHLKMLHPGFYPRGGGVIQAAIDPVARISPLRLRPPTDQPHITGFSAVAGLPTSIAERQVRQAVTRLKKNRLSCDLSVETWPGGPGTVLGLLLNSTPAPTLFFGLGERGKPAERVADEAVDALFQHFLAAPAAVDSHSADQILLPAALADGASEYPVSCVTDHLLTNIEVIRRFLSRELRCEGKVGEVGRVVIQ